MLERLVRGQGGTWEDVVGSASSKLGLRRALVAVVAIDDDDDDDEGEEEEEEEEQRYPQGRSISGVSAHAIEIPLLGTRARASEAARCAL